MPLGAMTAKFTQEHNAMNADTQSEEQALASVSPELASLRAAQQQVWQSLLGEAKQRVSAELAAECEAMWAKSGRALAELSAEREARQRAWAELTVLRAATNTQTRQMSTEVAAEREARSRA